MDKKSNSFAKNYRNIGNRHFRKQEYFDALIFYNRSLCVAENGSEAISLAFANRSAVYMKLNHFNLCLENIQLARDNNYPAEKMEKLEKRERDCKELMKTLKPNPEDNPFNYFKLSYPPNPKYPQIVDCLQLRKDQQGVHVITTRELKTGDIIAIEEPNFATLNPSARLHRCSFCLKDKLMNLIPCTGCAMAMFCSEKCRQKALNGFHHFDCTTDAKSSFESDFPLQFLFHCLKMFDNSIEKLQKFLDANRKSNTVFDFDLSDPDDPMYEKTKMLASLSNVFGHKQKFQNLKSFIRNRMAIFAEKNEEFSQLWRMHSKSLIKLIDEYDGFCSGTLAYGYFSKNVNVVETEVEIIIKELQMLCDANFHGIKNEDIGRAAYPFLKLLNHSCDPNVFQLQTSEKMVIYVCKPIKKGSEIFRTTASSFDRSGPASERIKHFKSIYGFTCNCEACKKNWPTVFGLRAVDPSYRYEAVSTFTSHEQAKKNIAQNNAYIDEHYKEHNPTKEVYFTIDKNYYELCRLTRPSFYP